ncbi:MAG: HNH endonuclease [Candidatus Uhrbacteria bacterium]
MSPFLNTLVLNDKLFPVGIIAWQQAVQMCLDGGARRIQAYPGRFVRSAHLDVPWPSVILDPSRTVGLGLTANRRNVIARDRFACQYCGVEPRNGVGHPNMDALTIDHVVPRCQAEYGYVESWYEGVCVPVSSWENLVAACEPCNLRKAGRTPGEANMPLLSVPTSPGILTSVRILCSRVKAMPETWEPYLEI